MTAPNTLPYVHTMNNNKPYSVCLIIALKNKGKKKGNNAALNNRI